MVSVTVRTGTGLTKKIFPDNILLADALEVMGYAVKKPCGGKGICGRCRVKASGALTPPSENSFVLACKSEVRGEVYVDLTDKTGEALSVAEGVMPGFEKNPLIKSGYGAAVDIGTTTIAACIYKFPECECVKTLCIENPQTRFGADVLTRIEFAKENLSLLGSLVGDAVADMLGGFDIKKTVITGNTIMLHLYCGLDPSGMAEFPFEPKSLFGKWQENTYIMPCMTAYAGADITAAILASGMTENKTALLADLGTNGEMALWHGGKLTVCSAAAGPAFEAVGVKNGTSSLPGAINHVTAEGYTTISDMPPIGICGSGLTDAIALLLDLGRLDPSGYLENPFEIHGSKISVFPDDIRLFQLAKSAVRSGLDCLLDCCGITCADVDAFYLAGGLGNCIDAVSAAKTGIIPPGLAEKSMPIGNAALSGAAMLLLNEAFIGRAERLAKSANLLELAGNDSFGEKFLENMHF